MKKNRLTVVSNGTLYTFRDVPERKYRNYLSLFLQDCDTTNFRPGASSQTPMEGFFNYQRLAS